MAIRNNNVTEQLLAARYSVTVHRIQTRSAQTCYVQIRYVKGAIREARLVIG